MADNGKVPEAETDPPVSDTSSRPFSLRIRLVLLGTLLLVVALGLVGLALNTAHFRSAVSALQARMESYVYLVLAAAEVNEAGLLEVPGTLGDPRLDRTGSGIYVHIHGRTEHWNSPSALGLELPEMPVLQAGQSSFSEPVPELRYFTYRYGVGFQDPDGGVTPFTVTVLVEPSEIEQQTRAFREGLWRSLGAAGLILVLAQSLMFILGFRPLKRVAQDVARIESGRASRLAGAYPRELDPLVRNVNRLLDTEEKNQQRVRNALDSLAHSLKTPLAVLQAGLEVRGGEAVRPMQNAADEMHHLIATRLERAGASARRALAEPVAVRPQLERVVDSLQKVYSQKMIETEIRMKDDLKFFGEQRDLLELIGNLLDNAFKYGSSRVRVEAAAVDPASPRPGLWLRVDDDGAGIDEAQRQRLLKRGVRGDERVEGHGLGLAIVMELATAYGGQVSIGDSELGGAMLYLEIPAS